MKTPKIWMPLHIGDLNTACLGLTLEQKGAVVTLLMLFWTAGEFPADENIPSILGLSPARWLAMQGRVADALEEYFDRAEFPARREKAAKTSDARRKVATTRHERERAAAIAERDAIALQNPSKTETDTEREEKKRLGEGTEGHEGLSEDGQVVRFPGAKRG